MLKRYTEMRLVTIIFLSIFLMGALLNDARKANSAFQQGNFAEAAELYQQAISQDPDNPRLYFNLAKTLYELGQGDAAVEAYDRYKSLAELPVERSFADYNKGRMLTDQENYQEAVEFFKEALRNNPTDSDTKFNYELAIQRQQEQEQQEQDPESEPGEGEDDQNNPDQQDNQQDEDPDQDSESDQQPGQPEQEDGDSQEQPQPLEMTPEEAQNILDALQQLERELLENQKKESTEPPSRNEKDW